MVWYLECAKISLLLARKSELGQLARTLELSISLAANGSSASSASKKYFDIVFCS